MAEWTASYINDLPDPSFAVIESGGEKDDAGKTVPRSLRHFPHHAANGDVDLPHLRNALGRLDQSDLSDALKSKARKHLEAHAEEENVGEAAEKSLAVKFVDGSDDLIEGLILPYGGPLGGRDLTGTFFTKDTNFCLEWFPEGGRPGLYAHGFDGATKTSVIGREVKSWVDDKGRWLQAQLDKSHQYWAEIKELVDAGALRMSSGAVDHLVEVAAKSGAIKQWPWVEWSLVPNPANPDAVVYQVKSAEAVQHLVAIGLTPPEPLAAITPAVKGIQTFSDIQAAAVMDDELPEAFDTLRSAIYSAIWAVGADMQPYSADDKQAAIQQSLTEFGAYVVGILDRAARSAPPATKEDRHNSGIGMADIQSIHDHSASLGAACSGAGKATDVPPAPVLAIRAGNGAAPTSEADLATVRKELATKAVETARSLLGRH
jgi:hypothetical protein